MKVEGLALLGRGGEAAVYALDEERVVRVYHGGVKREDVEGRRVMLEEIAAGAAGLPFEVPVVLDVDVMDGQVVAIEKRIRGVSMDEALKLVRGEERVKLIESYLETAVLVGEIAVGRPFFGEMWCDEPVTDMSWWGFLEKRAEKSLAHEGTKAQRGKIEDVVKQMPNAYEKGFVHLDYFPGNVMVDGGRVTAVLDFGYACVMGDARILPCLATAYLTLGRTADVAQPDMDVAHAWMAARGYDALYEPVVTWMAMYWMMVPQADDPVARAWCLSILGDDFSPEDVLSPQLPTIQEETN